MNDRKEHGLGTWMIAIVWALLLARWFVPAEGTASGDTLWLTLFTAGTAAVWAWFRSNDEQRTAVTGIWDRAVWWLVITHVAAACAVLVTLGQKRAALTMIWEWTSVGLQFWLLRQTLVTARLRASFILTALVMWMAISGYGLWQNFVGLPSMQRLYREQRAELTELQKAEAEGNMTTPQRRARLNQLIQEFVSQGIPVEGREVGLFERRLESRDLMGFFALANSFGGMLATAVVLSCGLLVGLRGQRRDLVVLGLCSLLISLCLLLTKSRTAWCGALAGMAILSLLMMRSHSVLRRRLLVVAAAGVATLALLVPITIALGGLDREVLSEAGKSLSYRGQYWTATLAICRQHPWLGVGPGNFRHHYLQHRVPGASEEIADPHQFVLDVAANAGLLGLAALVALLGLFVRMIWIQISHRTAEQTQEAALPETDEDRWLPVLAIGLAALLVVGWQFVIEGRFNSECAVAGLAAAGAAGLMMKLRIGAALSQRSDVITSCSVASATALLVHLSGSGGFAAPAILNWLLALMAVGSMSLPEGKRDPLLQRPILFWRVAAVSYLGLTIVIAQFGWLPVLLSQMYVTSGDQEFVTPGKLREARGQYQLAAYQDPLLASPWMGQSRVAFSMWLRYGTSSSSEAMAREAFDEGVRAIEAARLRDPFNASITHELATWWLKRFERSRDPQHLKTAIESFEIAAARYPTHATWLAELALANQLAGNTAVARSQAADAVKLDDLNRRAGHIDRYLPEEMVAQLKALSDVAATSIP